MGRVPGAGERIYDYGPASSPRRCMSCRWCSMSAWSVVASGFPARQPAHAINAGCYSRVSASSADEVRWRITNFARNGLYPVG
jgi:hypothetical protein